MGIAKRIIPCLDVARGRVVKGVNFVNLRDAGDPVECARAYDAQGADEIALLDIDAAAAGRATMLDVVFAVASEVFVPLTVGGGVRGAADFEKLLKSGADKVSVNSAAVADPSIVRACARHFGSQCVVVAIDARRRPDDGAPRWEVVTQGGRLATGIDAIEWARRAYDLGAGEILLTSMDRDGALSGFDLELTRAVAPRGRRACYRFGRRRRFVAFGRRAHRRRGRRRVGGQHFSRRRTHDRRSQAFFGRARESKSLRSNRSHRSIPISSPQSAVGAA